MNRHNPFSRSSTIQELNERSRDILRNIVEEYLGTGEPVGSKTLSRRLSVGLSPASIRSVMADLEAAGLLFSPHTSAGRLPTDRGLRLFVDGLLEVGNLSRQERESIAGRCRAEGQSVEDLLTRATEMLSGLSSCAGLVVAPKADSALRHVEFVSLSPGRALVVLVSEGGMVENRIIEVPLGLPPAALAEASNYLSTRLAGRTIKEAHDEILKELEGHQVQLDEMTSRVVEAGLAMPAGGGSDSGAPTTLIVRGQANLLDDVKALEDLEHIRALLEELEAKRDIVRLLDLTQEGQGVRIFIGAENELFGLSDCSVVAAPYGDSSQKVVGVVGVIGPTRLNYARIIPMVDYTARVIGRLIG